jgi:hypothetical protein
MEVLLDPEFNRFDSGEASTPSSAASAAVELAIKRVR